MNLRKPNLVLLVATVALAVPTTIQLYGEAESFTDYTRIPLMFDGLTEDNVGFIAIGKPKAEQPQPNPQNPDQKVPVAYDQLTLQRSDKGWAIGPTPGAPNDLLGVPVNSALVDANVFEHLRKIRADRETMIQQGATPEQLAEYGLDEAHATLMKVSDRTNQHVVASLYVGNEAADKITGAEAVRGVFVRKADTNDVVLYEYDKGWSREVDPNRWIDRVLLKLAPETVTRIALANAASGGTPIVFERKDNQASWSCAAPPEGKGAVRQAEVEGFLQRMRWLSVQDYKLPMQRAGNLAVLGLQPPQITLEITFKDGETERTATLQVGNRVDGDENVHYLTSSEAPFLMTWPAAMVTGLETDVGASWFDPAGPPRDEEQPDAGKDKKPDDGK